MSDNRRIVDLNESTTLNDPWGEASKTRGLTHMQLAMDFVAKYPIGTRLDVKEFDAWAQHCGLLNTPPLNTPKESDAWKAHLHRRHELRYKINRSGSHPRLWTEGSTPFSFDKIADGLYEVRAPHQAAAQAEIPLKVSRYMETKRKHLAHLMQSQDWDQLPPYERVMAEAIFDDIDGFHQSIHDQANRIHNKLTKLEARIRRAVEIGQIKPQNGGIKKLLTTNSDDDEIDE